MAWITLLVLPNAGDVFPTQTVPLNISSSPASLMPTGSVLNALKCCLSFNRHFLRDVARVPQEPWAPAFLSESWKAISCFLLTPVTEHIPFYVLFPFQSFTLEPREFAANPASLPHLHSRPRACLRGLLAGLWFRGGEVDNEFGMESVEDRTVPCSGGA